MDVGGGPCSAELAVDGGGGDGFALSAERLPQAEERAAVARIAGEVVAEDGLGLRGPAGDVERGAERFADRVVPRRRLVVGESVFALDGATPRRDCSLAIARGGGETRVEDGAPDGEHGVGAVQVEHRVGRHLRPRFIEGGALGLRALASAGRGERDPAREMPERGRHGETGIRRRHVRQPLPAAEAQRDVVGGRHEVLDEAEDRTLERRVRQVGGDAGRGAVGGRRVASHAARRAEKLEVVRQIQQRVDAGGGGASA